MSEDKRGPKRVCPYCDGDIADAELPICKPCGVTVRYCEKCKITVKREATACPQCGGELEWK